MPRNTLVIDVNIFLATFFFDSKICNKVLDSVKDEIFILLSCDEFLDEVNRKVEYFLQKRPQTQVKEINFWLKYIQETAKYIKLTSELKICRDPKDDYLVNLAIDGLAKYLVTRDKDLLEIADTKIQNILITPENFLVSL